MSDKNLFGPAKILRISFITQLKYCSMGWNTQYHHHITYHHLALCPLITVVRKWSERVEWLIKVFTVHIYAHPVIYFGLTRLICRLLNEYKHYWVLPQTNKHLKSKSQCQRWECSKRIMSQVRWAMAYKWRMLKGHTKTETATEV